jgi:O-antigen ligase
LKLSHNFILLSSIFILLCIPYPGFLGKGVLRLIDVFVISYLGFWSFYYLSTSKNIIKHWSLLLLLIIIIAYQLVIIFTSVTSVSLFKDTFEMYKILLLFFAFLLGLKLANKIDNDLVSKGVNRIFYFMIIVAFLQFLVGPSIFIYLFSGRTITEIDAQFTTRVVGTLGNPNYFALANIGFFFYGLTNYIYFREKKGIIITLLAFIALLVSQSRTNLVVLIILFVCFLLVVYCSSWASKKHKKIVFYILSLFSVIAIFILILMLKFGVLTYIFSGFSTVYNDGLENQNSFGTRLLMWKYYLLLIEQQFLFGYGPSKDYFDYAVADNNYIFITFKYGFVGLVMYMILWLSIIFSAFKSFVKKPNKFSSLVLFLALATLASSFLAETMESLRLSPLLFLFAGVSLGQKDKLYYVNNKSELN